MVRLKYAGKRNRFESDSEEVQRRNVEIDWTLYWLAKVSHWTRWYQCVIRLIYDTHSPNILQKIPLRGFPSAKLLRDGNKKDSCIYLQQIINWLFAE